MDREMSDPEADLSQTVEEVRSKLENMKKILAEKGNKQAQSEQPKSSSVIDGTFLSTVFSVVLILIVCVTYYAFKNLYNAIVKKFHLQHTEL